MTDKLRTHHLLNVETGFFGGEGNLADQVEANLHPSFRPLTDSSDSVTDHNFL